MSNVLLVTSSALVEASASRKIATALVNAIKSTAGQASSKVVVTCRDVSDIKPVSLAGLSSLRVPEDERTPEQAAAAQYADAMIEEVEAASIVVITAPMYTFTIPASLKAWIEYLNRPGRAFVHTEDGDRGLLVNKKVFVVLTRGSKFSIDDPMNFQERYLTSVLSFFGMTDVTFIVAEATASEEGKQQIAKAIEKAEQLGADIAKTVS